MTSNSVNTMKGGGQFLNCRICWKVALATFFAVLLVEAIILIPSYKNYSRDWQQNKHEQALSAAKGIFSSMHDFSAASVDEMTECLNILTRSMTLLGWTLYSSGEGEKLAQGGNLPATSISKDTRQSLVDTSSGQVLDVLWRGNTFGLPYDIQARLSMDGLTAALEAFLIRIFGLIAIISLFATIVTMFVLHKTVLRPVLSLRSHLQKEGVETGDLKTLISDVKGDDEIGDVVDAFNDMVINIGDKHRIIRENEKELKNARDNLERRVDERTDALRREIKERQGVETELRENERRLFKMANYDELTDLPNRLLGLDRLNQAIELTKRHHCSGALMFIDLDNFKEINDTMGHGMGDELLMQTAGRLSSALRGTDSVTSRNVKTGDGPEALRKENGDIVARIGGDEFMVILPSIASGQDAALVAGRLSEACAEPFFLNNHEVFVTASIGITVFPEDGAEAQALMMSADTALYAVKDSGRNGFQFFSPEMNKRLIERLEIESQLRHALDNDEFTVLYQPIVDVKTSEIIAVEALLRWNNSTLGWVLPDQFIHVAEGTGLIIPIGAWVLDEACKVAAELDRMGLPIRMAINVSARQFRGGHFVESVVAALEAYELPHDRLEVEITESLLVDEQSEAVNTIKSLRKLGVRLSIDDFGTGYSALSYLRRFDVNTLKIDRSFVSGVSDSEQDASLARTIIAMAKNFGLEIIAEGVESESQLEFLKKHQCDFAQGYYFGKPMPYEKLLEVAKAPMVV